MKRLIVIVLATVAVSNLVGCSTCRVCRVPGESSQAHQAAKADRSLKIAIRGILIKPSGPQAQTEFLVDTGGGKNRGCLGLPVDPNKWIDTPHILKMCVQQDHPKGTYDYQLLFGPYWDSPSATLARGMIETSEAKPKIEEGWLYIIQSWPQVGSEYVWAASSGTKAVLQIDRDVVPPVDRLFLLEGSFSGVGTVPQGEGTPMECVLADGMCELEPGEYYEVTADGVLSKPMPIASAPPAVRAFLEFVGEKAQLAGMPTSPYLLPSRR